jgi:hypothetical protein
VGEFHRFGVVRYSGQRSVDIDVSMKMQIRLTILLLITMLFGTSGAEEIKIAMSLDTARRLMESSGAKEELNAYHFPWTSKFVEVKVLDGETPEQSEKRTASELKKVSGKSGYSVFFTLKDKTRLEIVLEIDGDWKVIHGIRIGEPTKEYEDKTEWISAGKEGKLSVLTSFDPNR